MHCNNHRLGMSRQLPIMVVKNTAQEILRLDVLDTQETVQSQPLIYCGDQTMTGGERETDLYVLSRVEYIFVGAALVLR